MYPLGRVPTESVGTLVVYMHSVAIKQTVIEQFGKIASFLTIALLVCDVYQCIVVIDIA
jgi:hypothetical protein